ncbi:MAG: NAD(P)-dependent oxidoreductase [Halioglobus sp.]
MAQSKPMNVLILDEDYHQYQQLLAAAGITADAGANPVDFGDGYDVLLAQPDLAARYLRQGGKVPWIQSTWAGVDALVVEARSAGVLVTGLKNIFGPQMAEYVFAYLLSEARSLTFFRMQQEANSWSPRPPKTLAGKSMGILGTGTIGGHVASVAKSFGMQTVGISRSGAPVEYFDRVGPSGDMLELLRGSDVLVNTLPGTEQTQGVLSGKLLNVLAVDATVFNLGRGHALREDELRDWLEAHNNASAVLDVFAEEPLPADHWLWQHSQVSITPHISAVSFADDVVRAFLANFERRRQGINLTHVVDLESGY